MTQKIFFINEGYILKDDVDLEWNTNYFLLFKFVLLLIVLMLLKFYYEQNTSQMAAATS